MSDDKLPIIYTDIVIGCIYRGCGKKGNNHFCTTHHAILDFLDSFGPDELMTILNEWRKKNE